LANEFNGLEDLEAELETISTLERTGKHVEKWMLEELLTQCEELLSALRSRLTYLKESQPSLIVLLKKPLADVAHLIGEVKERMNPVVQSWSEKACMGQLAPPAFLQLTQSLDMGRVSSGKNCVVDAKFFEHGTKRKGIDVKAKISYDEKALQAEHDHLRALNQKYRNPSLFVREFAILKSSQIHLCIGDDTSKIDGASALVLEKGYNLDLYEYLGRGDVEFTHYDLISYAAGVVRAVNACHKHEVAWMDVKPHNFVLIFREGRSPKVLGIDLDRARNLHDLLTADYSEVTWEYTSPELAFRDSLTNALVLPEGRLLSTPEQFDIWALGVTVMEVMQKGKSFCNPMFHGDVEKIKTNLRLLTDDCIKDYIHSNFMGPEFKPIRQFLLGALKINPNDRKSAEDLQRIIEMKVVGGTTAALEGIQFSIKDMQQQNQGLAMSIARLTDVTTRLEDSQLQMHAGLILLHSDIQSGEEEARQRMCSIHSLL
jgi:serine/threonine protein kinase